MSSIGIGFILHELSSSLANAVLSSANGAGLDPLESHTPTHPGLPTDCVLPIRITTTQMTAATAHSAAAVGAGHFVIVELLDRRARSRWLNSSTRSHVTRSAPKDSTCVLVAVAGWEAAHFDPGNVRDQASAQPYEPEHDHTACPSNREERPTPRTQLASPGKTQRNPAVGNATLGSAATRFRTRKLAMAPLLKSAPRRIRNSPEGGPAGSEVSCHSA